MPDAFLAASPEEIFVACDTVFSPEPWISWEPETLLSELSQEVSDAARDKLMAVQAVAANSSLPCRNSTAFENMVNAFCNNICVVDAPQPPYVEEMFYAVNQLKAIVRRVHGDSAKVEFSGSVPNYMAAAARYRGWAVLPEELSCAQKMLDFLTSTQARNELSSLLSRVRSLYAGMRHAEAKDILASKDIQELLSQGDANATFVRQALGLFLFDPCLPYRVSHEADQA